jgi:glycosyltransferase involved in cell wall biosynthesis
MCTMNKTIEYMALGLPVVQFDLTEGRASAGDASLYVEQDDPKSMADAILRLLDDAELRQALGQRGRERVETRLAWHHQAPHLLAAYERVLSR